MPGPYKVALEGKALSLIHISYLARYPLALVLHRKDGVTPGTVAKLHSWLQMCIRDRLAAS